MMTASRRLLWSALLALFVGSQLATATLAVSGHHHHVWDAGAREPVCWVCLAISLASIATALAGAFAFRDELASP